SSRSPGSRRRAPARRWRKSRSASAPWATSAAPARSNPPRSASNRSSKKPRAPPSRSAARRAWTTRRPKRRWNNARRKATFDETPLMQPLRFATAGSVDDGKSTLIGRLLYDARAIQEDQLAAVERASLRRGGSQLDLSLLTDGLEAEREQGITIDVAYRYFAPPRRKFIIAASPGHEQY